ncbi:MAG: leucine-rich repeat domain-containing protein, partial [Oscillospiraceae bacterium]|nr:leucine-rich repeat domain-containing protein [Oscillospiraceae bacterium]
MKKRILSVLLAIVMVVGMFPVTAGATTAEPVKTWSIGASESGTDAVVAKLYTNVTDNTKYDLVISGTGEMGTTTGTKMPWRGSEYQQHIVSVTVESGVTNVNSYAFKDCTALTSVTIGDTVTEIGSFAFNGCTALTSVTLGATVTEIWGYAFGGCTSLTAYTVDSENTAYSATDGILFSKDGTTLVSYPSNKSGTSYTVPNSVTKISSSAFCDVTTLTELTIPHTTTSIVGTIFHGKAFEGKITIKGHTGSAAETYTKGDPDSTTFVSICSDGDDADTLCDVCGYDTAHAAHPICGATHSDIGDHTGTCEAVEWTAWDGGTITYTNDTASVYLSTNVTLESTLTVAANQTLHLCLNGHSITSSGENTITVSGGATLNICDCSTGETGGKIANTCSSNGRGIINSGIVNIYGGTIEATGHSGRGIYLNSGTVNVYGGSVSGDTYSIYNDGTGTVNIIGGSVGKDIYNYGDNSTVKVSGGSVEGGTYGIQNNKGTVDITGGTVSGEEGIYNPNGGRVVVTAGSVSGEYTGIYNSGTLTVSGGTVKSTGTDGNNYGIYNFYHGAGSLELSGAPTITGATAGVYLDGGSITLGGELTYVEEKAISVG